MYVCVCVYMQIHVHVHVHVRVRVRVRVRVSARATHRAGRLYKHISVVIYLHMFVTCMYRYVSLSRT